MEGLERLALVTRGNPLRYPTWPGDATLSGEEHFGGALPAVLITLQRHKGGPRLLLVTNCKHKYLCLQTNCRRR
jgi:hypothetical protein